jgi:hypothetical protein
MGGKYHGMHKSSTYNSWSTMIQRCTNPNNTHYKYYGGRGISIHSRWLDFKIFLEDMGERPEGTTLDRIDNQGNYSPNNCRWVSRKVQASNRHNPSGLEHYNGRRTHCKRGHLFSGKRDANGFRFCEQCTKMRLQTYKLKKVEV